LARADLRAITKPMHDIAIAHSRVNVKTTDGTMNCHAFRPEIAESIPAVVFYMDGIGVRADLFTMAERLARKQFYVLMPNLYYRSHDAEPIDVSSAFAEGPQRARVLRLMQSINNECVMRDTAACFKFLEEQPEIEKKGVACVGYCMGGAFALSAAGTFPERVVAAASIHGAGLATARPDSPHLLADKIKASLYVATARQDPWFTPEEAQLLRTTLLEKGIRCKMETFPAEHGFAVYGTPAYNSRAADQHWLDLSFLLRKAFGRR
jgi:carboxymethylenebutenolidase